MNVDIGICLQQNNTDIHVCNSLKPINTPVYSNQLCLFKPAFSVHLHSLLSFISPFARRGTLCLGDEREEVDDGQTREDDDGRGDESVPHVVEEREFEPGDASRLLCHYEIRNAPQEGDVAGECGEPGQKESDDGDGARFRALARGAHEVGDLLYNQDRHGDVAEYLASDDDEHGEEDDSAHALQIHRLADGEEDDARYTGVLEPLKPVEEAHEHEEDSPVHFSDGVEGVFLVETGID